MGDSQPVGIHRCRLVIDDAPPGRRVAVVTEACRYGGWNLPLPVAAEGHLLNALQEVCGAWASPWPGRKTCRGSSFSLAGLPILVPPECGAVVLDASATGCDDKT